MNLDKSKNNVRLPKKQIRKMIAIVSSKGGVGKSTITALLGCELRRRGFSVGILDADITGASIARMFGLGKESVNSYIAESRSGIKILSFALLLKDADRAVIWRGPLLSNALRQIYNGADFGEIDYLLIDSPPGTGDVPLTLYENYPLDGIVLVTTPQDLVNEIVAKSARMAQRLGVPVIGIVENFSHLQCECGKRHELYGKSKTAELAEKLQLPLVASLPVDAKLADAQNNGRIEDYRNGEIMQLADAIHLLSQS